MAKQAPQAESSPQLEARMGSQGPAMGEPTTELVWGHPSSRDSMAYESGHWVLLPRPL